MPAFIELIDVTRVCGSGASAVNAAAIGARILTAASAATAIAASRIRGIRPATILRGE